MWVRMSPESIHHMMIFIISATTTPSNLMSHKMFVVRGHKNQSINIQLELICDFNEYIKSTHIRYYAPKADFHPTTIKMSLMDEFWRKRANWWGRWRLLENIMEIKAINRFINWLCFSSEGWLNSSVCIALSPFSREISHQSSTYPHNSNSSLAPRRISIRWWLNTIAFWLIYGDDRYCDLIKLWLSKTSTIGSVMQTHSLFSLCQERGPTNEISSASRIPFSWNLLGIENITLPSIENIHGLPYVER